MGKDRKAHEMLEELLALNGLNERSLAEKIGVSELVIRNYLTGLNKDNRNYARIKAKIKESFGIGDDFFDESHVPAPGVEYKPEPERKIKRAGRTAAKTTGADESKGALPDKGQQPAADLNGAVTVEDKTDSMEEVPVKKETGREEKKATAKKSQTIQTDPLLAAIKAVGNKAKLPGKKKDITPEAAEAWASAYEEEMKQSVARIFAVVRESLRANFVKEEAKPVYARKKVAEIVELVEKAKEEDLNLILAMLKKMIR